jgi:hypothetical protein
MVAEHYIVSDTAAKCRVFHWLPTVPYKCNSLTVLYCLLCNMLDRMTLPSGLTTSRRVSCGPAPYCHNEPKGWGPLRLSYDDYITFCIILRSSVDSDSHYSSLADLITRQVQCSNRDSHSCL